MASDVMSLFGLDPAVIQQQRVQKGVDQASAMSADYAIGAAGGGMMGAGINTAFGLQTPEMAQAGRVQDSIVGADLSTPEGLRAAASKLMQAGAYAQAMDLYQQASNMVSAEPRPVAAVKPSYANAKTYELPSVDGKEREQVWGLTVDGILMIDTPEGRIKAPAGTTPWVAPVRPKDSDTDQGSLGDSYTLQMAEDLIVKAGHTGSTGITNTFTDDLSAIDSRAMANWITGEVSRLREKAGGGLSQNDAVAAALATAELGIEGGGGINTKVWNPPKSSTSSTGKPIPLSTSAQSYVNQIK